MIIIIVTGLTLAFGDTAGGFRRLIQIVFGLSIAFAASLVLSVVLLLFWRSARLMGDIVAHEMIPGFEAPVHRALTEPILLGGAPRAVAILNGTLSAAIGLGCGCGSRGSSSGRSATWRRSGPPSVTRSSSRWCAGICATRHISKREVR